MNHDYSHCLDFNDSCPKKCFRAELVRDLRSRKDMVGVPVSWTHYKGSDECPKVERRMRLIDADALLKYKSDHETISTHLIYNAPTVDAIPISFVEEMKAWAEENGSAEYANDLTHLLSVWAERKEE